MKEIPLTQGKVAIVDDDDFERLRKHKWCLSSGYPFTNTRDASGKRSFLKMHRVIMNAKKGEEVDHRNRNKLDCRKQNLRMCTRQQNTFNRGLSRNNTSGCKGVSWYKRNKKWGANIRCGIKTIFLGLFECKEMAYREYVCAAKILHGEFSGV